ncbi:flagellar hook assembly protein FlgD [Roseateles amylovorans]|uniref:Basal-body rod modification protein FlgD n=1 Tax=Roseateles amylovorans TaxID=2978473 RepID=A0ABY6B5P2_9BURK|nr:flagellar hook capping FlgD N-terminal domain-containing protein [Roseateles amylovorans]UXH79845.1 flagellar hook assembly protein FlgD [Roseateles amylovorans]
MDYSTLNVNSSTSKTTPTAAQSSGAADTQDRFLKLLVAQMQNQDPMNPMDNAAVTTQLAQIQTVTGVGTLNNSIQNLAGQFTQMQALQSVSLVGRTVTLPGNQLSVENGKANLSFDLAGNADAVKLEVLNGAGNVIATEDLGKLKGGNQTYTWDASKSPETTNLRYRITASNGGVAVGATTLTRDVVRAVNTSGSTLQLELKNSGIVDYDQVRSLG